MKSDYSALIAEDTKPVRVAMARAADQPTQAARKQALQRELSAVSPARMSFAAKQVLLVLQRVAGRDDAVGTAERYEVALRAFLVHVGPISCSDVAEARELNWHRAGQDWIRSAASDGDRRVRGAVFDHLMEGLGLASITDREPAPSGPTAPVPIVTPALVAKALHAVESSSAPMRTRLHAELILRMRSIAPLRGDEFGHLRRQDIHMGQSIMIAICADAGARLKNDGASRSIELRAPPAELRRLLGQLVDTCGQDGRLFNDSELDEAEKLANEAIQVATHDAQVNLMAMRRLAIDSEMGAILSPERQSPLRAVDLRAGLLRISADAGHVSHFTAANNYASSHADWLFAHVCASPALGVEFNPSVRLQVFGGLSSGAAKKRVQRGRTVLPATDGPPAQSSCAATGGITAATRAVSAAVQLQYLFARLTSVGRLAAECMVSIAPSSADALDDLLEEAQVAPVAGTGQLTLAQSNVLVGLYRCLSGARRTGRESVRRALPFKRVDEGWVFQSFDHLQSWNEILQSIHCGGFSLRVGMSAQSPHEMREACAAYCVARDFVFSNQSRRSQNLQRLVTVELYRQGWNSALCQHVTATALLLFLFTKEEVNHEPQSDR